MRKVIVAGTRYYEDRDTLYKILDSIIRPGDIIVSGKCPTGADKFGEDYAEENGHEIDPYPADWDKYGLAAGPIRNEQMASVANIAIVAWNGKSKGTRNLIKHCRSYDVPVKMIRYK